MPLSLFITESTIRCPLSRVSYAYLAHDGEPGVQVGEPAGRQAAAARRELQERLALAHRHLHQHLHQPQETRAVHKTIDIY